MQFKGPVGQWLVCGGRLTDVLKLPLNVAGRDRLRGRSLRRKALRSVSRAVPLESSPVVSRLRLLKGRRKKQNKTRDATPSLYFLFFFFNLRFFVWTPLFISHFSWRAPARARCNLLASAPAPRFMRLKGEPGANCAEKPEPIWRMELIVVRLFWLCARRVSSGSVRLCPSSSPETAGFIPLRADSSVREKEARNLQGRKKNAEPSFFLFFLSPSSPSRGFNHRMVGAPWRGESQRKTFMWPFFL